MTWAHGTFARSLCARCGFAFPYLALRQDGNERFRVCEDCRDEPEAAIRRARRVKPVRTALRQPQPELGDA